MEIGKTWVETMIKGVIMAYFVCLVYFWHFFFCFTCNLYPNPKMGMGLGFWVNPANRRWPLSPKPVYWFGSWNPHFILTSLWKTSNFIYVIIYKILCHMKLFYHAWRFSILSFWLFYLIVKILIVFIEFKSIKI